MDEKTRSSWKKTISDIILTSEGGYTNHPADRGGPTNWGITAQVLAEYLDVEKVDEATVKSLTMEQAVEIYLKKWVEGTGIENLDPSLQMLVLDTMVNHGTYGGVKMLQRAIGEVEDGKCGPKTLSVSNARPRDAYYGLIRCRMKKYAGIVNSDPTQLVFLSGWINRLSRFVVP